MITLLCPTRNRPNQYKRMIESALATSSTSISIYTMLSEKDNKIYPTIMHDRLCSKRFTMNDNIDYPTAHKWNIMAEYAMDGQDQLFMLAADDMVFTTPEWDKALIDHYNALENKIHVYALRDSRDLSGTPHPIVTRSTIDAMGYFLFPAFFHWYIDSWIVEVAKANKCFTHLTDYMLVHDKSSDAGHPDETHSRIRAMGWHERDTWVNDKLKPIFFETECQRLRQAMAS